MEMFGIAADRDKRDDTDFIHYSALSVRVVAGTESSLCMLGCIRTDSDAYLARQNEEKR
jgi:hypothetical protein